MMSGIALVSTIRCGVYGRQGEVSEHNKQPGVHMDKGQRRGE